MFEVRFFINSKNQLDADITWSENDYNSLAWLIEFLCLLNESLRTLVLRRMEEFAKQKNQTVLLQYQKIKNMFNNNITELVVRPSQLFNHVTR